VEAQTDPERFGPYLVVRTSGSGGMGRVQLALRTDGQKPDLCIIKRMHPDERAPDQEARFDREARIAARLSHENIARTLNVDTVEGEPCLIQEFIEGVNLARLIRQAGTQPVRVWAAAHIVREVANALTYAHELGEMEIVHRDVTPENVMLSYAGDVKLIDFGISRSRVDGTLTSIGAVVGRRAYVPPEVWAGAKPDRRADVYALGVVLWELVTGRRLEETDEATWSESIPDPRTVRPDVREDLAAVILRAVAPDPVERYQTAAEFRTALTAFVGDEEEPQHEIATLLAFYFNVERTKAVLAEQIEEAKGALQGSREAAGRRLSRRQGIWIAVLVAGLVFASGVGISGLRRGATARLPDVGRASDPIATKVSISPVAASPSTPKAGTVALEPSRSPPAPLLARPQSVGARAGLAADRARREENVDAVLRKASEEFDDGHLTDAVTLARRAASSGGGAKAHALLGYIYMSQGQLPGAERELAQAARMNPGDAEAATRLADVRRARSEQGE
jgi:protein kinase-like protein